MLWYLWSLQNRVCSSARTCCQQSQIDACIDSGVKIWCWCVDCAWTNRMFSSFQPPYYLEICKECSLPLVPLRITWKFGDFKIHLEVVTRGQLAVQFEALAMSSLVYTLGSCGGCHEGCLDLGVLYRGFLGKACVDRVFLGQSLDL